MVHLLSESPDLATLAKHATSHSESRLDDLLRPFSLEIAFNNAYTSSRCHRGRGRYV
jgi:hypothetical protein